MTDGSSSEPHPDANDFFPLSSVSHHGHGSSSPHSLDNHKVAELPGIKPSDIDFGDPLKEGSGGFSL